MERNNKYKWKERRAPGEQQGEADIELNKEGNMSRKGKREQE